jgi:hypothetical protein
MSGPDYEVLGSDPGDELKSGTPGASWGFRAAVLATVAALVLGGVAGAFWARGQDAQRRTARDEAAFTVSAAVTPALVAEKPHADGDSVVQVVELALVSAAPLRVSQVVVAWDATHAAYSDADAKQADLDALTPQAPARVRLSLREPCTTPALPGVATIPRLHVTARTQDGHRRQVVVDPLGLDQVWTAMAAACPDHDVTTQTTVALSGVKPLGKLDADFTLTFTNHSGTDVLISGVILARGFNTSEPQRPSQLQVFPNASASLVVRLTITSCSTAIEDVSPDTIRYVIASADDTSRQRATAVANTDFAEALGHLLTACVPS